MFYLSSSSKIIRNIPNDQQNVFLTFDDGPTTPSTEKILDVLHLNQTPATFFVIGKNAKQNKVLLLQMQKNGHQLFSHSTDHHYAKFFSSKKNLRSWVLESIDELGQITGKRHWGFRPPAGVLTPPLIEIAEEENLPLFLWQHRFFDTQRKWNEKMAQSSLLRMQSGDIILLHDRQKESQLPQFLQTLQFYIQSLKSNGLLPTTISRNS